MKAIGERIGKLQGRVAANQPGGLESSEHMEDDDGSDCDALGVV
jgi:hypothetical protein